MTRTFREAHTLLTRLQGPETASISSSGSLPSAAERLLQRWPGMQTSKPGGRAGAVQKKLGASRSIEPVRQEELMPQADSAASAAPTQNIHPG
jgi:hypothetical protein